MLFRHGRVTEPMPLAAAVPWPEGLLTLTPIGYGRAAEALAIAPTTAPGLAALQSIGGHCAAFWVPPLMAGLMVWATFLIGRRVLQPAVGIGAAWLVATSPVCLAMARSTMSDVPASACWAGAIACLLAGSVRSAIGAGLCASLAVLIRPNLVPLAAVLAVWTLWQDALPASARLRRCLAFTVAVVPGCLLVAWHNASAYGAALASGYGNLGDLFALRHVPVNAARYLQWLSETQSPFALVGLAAVLVPIPWVWPTPAARRAALLLALGLAVVWASSPAYRPWEAWWFLRFLLPGWPALCVGMAAVASALLGRAGRRGQVLAGVAVFLLGANGVRVAIDRSVFPPDEGERRYGTIAVRVRDATEPDSLIFAAQHSGSIRYYAGRQTIRFDRLDPAWPDRAVEWCAQRGRRPYFLIEDWERPAFESRFAAGNVLGRLRMTPVLVYKADGVGGTVLLYDARRKDGPTLRPPPIPDPRPRCLAPAGTPPCPTD